MALLSKALLFRFVKETNKKVTGLELQHFNIKAMWEESGRLFSVCTIELKDMKKKYEPAMDNGFSALKDEIAKLEAIEKKTTEIHEQLKELYFITGDLENFDKQTDILMDIKFNEN